MDKIFQALYDEIKHGDKEHQQWLYDKMEEFFRYETGKHFKLDMSTLETLKEQGHPIALTFGQKAVGLSFNPGGNKDVETVNNMYAAMIDLLSSYRESAEGAEKKRMYSVAITEAQSSQMWAVKAITWQY